MLRWTLLPIIFAGLYTNVAAQQMFSVSTTMDGEMAQVRLTNESTVPIDAIWWRAGTDTRLDLGPRRVNATWVEFHDVRAQCGHDPKPILPGDSHTLEVGYLAHAPVVQVLAVGFSDGTIVADAAYARALDMLHEAMLDDLRNVGEILRAVQPDTPFHEVTTKLTRLRAEADRKWLGFRSSRDQWPQKNTTPGVEIDEVSACESRLLDRLTTIVSGAIPSGVDSAAYLPGLRFELEDTIPAWRTRLQENPNPRGFFVSADEWPRHPARGWLA